MLDGDLSADEKADVQSWLATDETLRRRMERMARVHDLLNEWGASQPDIDWDRFGARVMSEIGRGRTLQVQPALTDRTDRIHRRRIHIPTLLRIIGPLAAAAVLVIAVGLPFRQTDPVHPASSPLVRVDVARPVGVAHFAAASQAPPVGRVRVQYAKGPVSEVPPVEGPRRLMIEAIARVDDRTAGVRAGNGGLF